MHFSKNNNNNNLRLLQFSPQQNETHSGILPTSSLACLSPFLLAPNQDWRRNNIRQVKLSCCLLFKLLLRHFSSNNSYLQSPQKQNNLWKNKSSLDSLIFLFFFLSLLPNFIHVLFALLFSPVQRWFLLRVSILFLLFFLCCFQKTNMLWLGGGSKG